MDTIKNKKYDEILINNNIDSKNKKQGEKATTTNEKTRLICLLLYFKVSFLQKARRQKKSERRITYV